MSLGLSQAGIDVLAGIDNAVECRKTYENNLPNSKYIRHDISSLSAPDLEKRLGLKVNDPHLIFAGCSPCQFWSKIRTDRTKATKTAFLLSRFQKFIKYFSPGFVIVENVPGLYTQKEKSILPQFIEFLNQLGYKCDDGIINANHFGVPQNRKRYLLVASRICETISLPEGKPDTSLVVSSFLGEKNGFAKIEAGHQDKSDFQHTTASLSALNIKRIKLTSPSGGDRTSWKDIPDLQIEAYRGKDKIFRDVYGRMFWNRPAPTITTRFNSLSNGRFGHPVEDRAISLREGATLQTFPKNFVFHGSNLNAIARQIGNAVPPELAKRIGEHLIKVSRGA